MTNRSRRFLIWLAVLSTVWVLANWPRNGGSLKRFLVWAGYPWTFAVWNADSLEWFDAIALVANIAVGLMVVVPVAWLCAGRGRHASEPPRVSGWSSSGR